MAHRRTSSLHGRANEAGVLFAAASAPQGFQRTLMPRSVGDQAIITGLSASANHALVSLIQDSVQAGALLFLGRAARRQLDEKRWSRASIAADIAAVGVGIAVQRAVRQRSRDPLPRAALRTGGFWLACTGVTGAAAGIVQEATARHDGRRSRALSVIAPAAAAIAAANMFVVRRREHENAGMESQTPPSPLESLGVGLAVTAGMSAVGAGERTVADLIARGASRVLPGSEMMWRPVGHALTLTAVAAAGRVLAVKMLHKIEHVEEAAEAALDFPPPNPLVSGSLDSAVRFATLSRAGRRYVWTVNPRDRISEVMGEAIEDSPIRVYVGLESANTDAARVQLAMHELERTGAFDREWLMIASPTGTGYVNYAAVTILEMLSRGNCATIAMQYSARPSPLSLDRVAEGRVQIRLLFDAIRDRLAECAPAARPKVVLFGESLGAWTSQDPFVDEGTRGLLDSGIDHAIWIGTPHFSKWKERVLYDNRTDVDPELMGVFNDIGEWEALPESRRQSIRFVMITHHDDGVGVFGPELAIRAPEWLRSAEYRHASVPKALRWTPTTTFFQVFCDMKNAAQVVPGVFAAKGHDYRADLLPFFQATLGLKATAAQLESIERHLIYRELLRSEWLQHHKTADLSLSAMVLERVIREQRELGTDTDGGVVGLIRDVIDDMGAEGGAETKVPAPTS